MNILPSLCKCFNFFFLNSVHISCITLGRTETIWDVLNPKWVRTFFLEPNTPKSQMIKITVYDRDSRTQDLDKQEVIGSCVCRVQDLIREGSNGKTMNIESLESKKTGTVTVIGELFKDCDIDHEVFLGQCKFKNTSLLGMFLFRPYITIYRRRDNKEWAPIFRSKTGRKGEDAAFAEDLLHRAKIRVSKQDATFQEVPLRIELQSHSSIAEHRLIGAVQMSLGSLRRQGTGKKISLGLGGESVSEMRISRSTLADKSSSFDLEISFRGYYRLIKSTV